MTLATVVGYSASTQKDENRSHTSIEKNDKHDKKYKKTRLYQFPEGGGKLFPDYKLVALYGSPDIPALGVLGEQPPEEAVGRIKQIVSEYKQYTKDKIMPAFELIASIASAGPTENGDFSQELPIGQLLPWVEIAEKQGVYVVLDLQPGRSDFLTQAKAYEPLLKKPHVGLALDPEWRLKPSEFHLEQIGSVRVEEVNATSQWLADMTKRYRLPQKLFLLHQFRLSMIEGREKLDTSREELAYTIQMDGQGDQTTKQETWSTIRVGSPPNIFFGWKNFYDEDLPILTSEQTLQIVPSPQYISYQ